MSIEVGNKVSGKVTGITKFGAFVDLGEGKNGLVHISEISDGYVKDINDVLSVGETVEVLVTNVADDGKIALSIRRVNGDAAAKPKPSHHDSGDKRPSRPQYKPNNQGHSNPAPRSNNSNFKAKPKAGTNDFDSLMSDFLKDSDDRLTSLKRNTESKRGGRGGRRG